MNMDKSHIKSIICFLIWIGLLAVPDTSLTQIQDQPPNALQELKIESDTYNTVSLDDLKQIRFAVEKSEDLLEDAQKMILNLVDQAISFHESEVQSRMQIDTLKQTVLQAPKRIQDIESELDAPLPPLENVAPTASGMTAVNREQQLKTLETDWTAATTRLN